MKTIQEIKTEFEQVLSDLRQIEINPEKSVDVALILIQESGKDRRAELYNSRNNGFNRNYNNGNNGSDKPVSEKQIKFLKDLGAENIPKTSREANALITQLKAKRGI